MRSKTSFPLRIQAQEREQMLYMARLHHIAETTTVADALAVLDLVPSHPPVPTDRI